MKTLDLGLSWSPDPVRVDDGLHANPSKEKILSLI